MTQDYIQKNKDKFLEELFEFIKIPSISADLSFKKDVLKAASFLEQNLKEIGVDNVELFPTDGYPIVYGEKKIDVNLPTILVYGHYDVQPADPYELWDSDPFNPIIKQTDIHPDGAIFARGACDDKGQMFMHVKAFEAMYKSGELSCNVKFMFEGEEEVGSKNLEKFVRSNVELLKADVVLVSDTGIINNETPSICVGLRGLSYVEVEVVGPNRDLHSGLYGGAVGNPINILSKMIASLHNEDGSINIPGFYSNVVEVSEKDRSEMAKAPFDLKEYQTDLSVDEVFGEKGYSTNERNSIRPSLDVNGIWGGYIGEGAKTVLPSKAYAKISMRLVPNQSSKEITQLFINHFENIAPPYVKVKITPHHGGEGVVIPTNFPAFLAAKKAMEKTFGKTPIPVRSGGSIPIVPMFEEVLGLKTILLGFGLDSDVIHSPNEHFGLFNFYKGIETIPYFYQNLADLKSK
ncbi:MAG: peptidase dimerization domain protein [Crocinitomicaceae bacterium]|nr:peptidase dimerization domain protein [Crocinitomicaceae bacterium]|tara:strand:+ start:11451 stop:12836 length:1386 start_codon:yes stop_codon:yes gene_type:complete